MSFNPSESVSLSVKWGNSFLTEFTWELHEKKRSFLTTMERYVPGTAQCTSHAPSHFILTWPSLYSWGNGGLESPSHLPNMTWLGRDVKQDLADSERYCQLTQITLSTVLPIHKGQSNSHHHDCCYREYIIMSQVVSRSLFSLLGQNTKNWANPKRGGDVA